MPDAPTPPPRPDERRSDRPAAPDPGHPTDGDHAAEEASTLAEGHGAGGPVTGDPQQGHDAGGGSSSRAQHPRGGDPNRAAGGRDI